MFAEKKKKKTGSYIVINEGEGENMSVYQQ